VGADGDIGWFAKQLLEVGRVRQDDIRAGRLRHADSIEADQLLHNDPFARLLGLLSQQWRTRAGAAWEVPWRLQCELGHLDVRRIADTPDEVRAAFATGSICRRPARMAEVTVRAANRVVDCYDGQAERVWDGVEEPGLLRARFAEFYGAGTKIASMSVGVLRRDFALPVEPGGDIAVDGNVRRVVRRTGLVTPDDTDDQIRAAARAMNPDDPSALDLGTWVVGSEYCRARRPACSAWSLAERCQKVGVTSSR
jgi:endonuclease III